MVNKVKLPRSYNLYNRLNPLYNLLCKTDLGKVTWNTSGPRQIR